MVLALAEPQARMSLALDWIVDRAEIAHARVVDQVDQVAVGVLEIAGSILHAISPQPAILPHQSCGRGKRLYRRLGLQLSCSLEFHPFTRVTGLVISDNFSTPIFHGGLANGDGLS